MSRTNDLISARCADKNARERDQPIINTDESWFQLKPDVEPQAYSDDAEER